MSGIHSRTIVGAVAREWGVTADDLLGHAVWPGEGEV